MGQKVLILGDSGTGKSTSLRNFKPEDVLVINSANKPLPFRSHLEVVNTSFNSLTNDVLNAMRSTEKKVIVIDDAQYIMSFQYMRRIKENGWDKWNDIQGDFFNIIKAVDELPNDVVVYFLSHLSRDDEGHEKIKTMGKMLDEKITIEGLFTVVLKTAVKDGQYYFLTQNSGLDTVKSPLGMFPSYAIDNDLKYVDEKLRNYYELGEFVPDEVVAEHDKEVARTEVEKPDADGRTRRRSRKSESASNTSAEEVSATSTEAPTEDAEKPKRTRRHRTDDGFISVPEGVESEVPFPSDDDAPAEEVTEPADAPEELPKRKARAKKEEAPAEVPTEEPKRKRRARSERSDIKAFPDVNPDDVTIPFE